MQSDRPIASKLDALDLAAIWPCCAPVAGFALPLIETVRAPKRARPGKAGSDGIW
jgi:hypothetical protein